MPAIDQGTRRGFARYGSALEYSDFAVVRGRQYVRAHSSGTAEELVERVKLADQVFANKLWRRDCAAWPSIRDTFRRRLIEFARRDPRTMDSAELRHTISALQKIFTEGVTQHFVQQPASMVPVGDWVRHTCEWTGASVAEVISVLHCCRTHSGGSLPVIDVLADSIRSSPAARDILCDQVQTPAVRLARLRQISPEISRRLDAYIDEYADRIITGFDITDATLRELPAFTISIISWRIDSLPGRGVNPNRVKKLRARVPMDKLDQFDEGLNEARAAYGLHDEDVRITYLWPLGLLRRAVLAGADRLAARGLLRMPEDVFQTTPGELDDLMTGTSSVCAAEISRRVEEWRSWASDDPPAAFGERTPSPDDGLLGTACARVTSAIIFYLAEMEGCPGNAIEPASPILRGSAASEGCYQGRARIVRDPADFANVSRGDVLVARTTSPAYNVILPTVGAIVTDRGGTLCHAAILAREFKIPAVVGAKQATLRIPDGADVLVDGSHGFVAVQEP
ncbi:MAG TPA: PEP-utilizing enzyme [Terriglobia bacterium]|nr:PEP-utilizing enzyme [Terriglobia bacterium]